MGYLEEYSEQEAHRAKRTQQVKRAVTILFALLVVAGALYYTFKNYREERRVKEFLGALERGDYPAAYAFWGCQMDKPCPNYSYKDFMDDWGPSGEVGKLRSYRLVSSHERGSGVVVAVVINDRPQKKLWVEKSNGTLGFAPPL